jgi:hypothetical protein
MEDSSNSGRDNPADETSRLINSRKHRRDDRSQSQSRSQEYEKVHKSTRRKETVQQKERAMTVGENLNTRVDTQPTKRKTIQSTQSLEESETQGHNDTEDELLSDHDDDGSEDSPNEEEPAEASAGKGNITALVNFENVADNL